MHDNFYNDLTYYETHVAWAWWPSFLPKLPSSPQERYCYSVDHFTWERKIKWRIIFLKCQKKTFWFIKSVWIIFVRENVTFFLHLEITTTTTTNTNVCATQLSVISRRKLLYISFLVQILLKGGLVPKVNETIAFGTQTLIYSSFSLSSRNISMSNWWM